MWSDWNAIDAAQRKLEREHEERRARIRVVPPEESPEPPQRPVSARDVPERAPTPPPAPKPPLDDRTALGLYARFLHQIAQETRERDGG